MSFWNFHFMVTPSVIKVIYNVGIAVLIIAGGSFYETSIPICCAIIILGNLLWRMICETWILMFQIHDRLVSIDWSLRKEEEYGGD